MKRMLPAVVAVALVLIAGLVHGFWTDRWHTNKAVEAAVANLNRVPRVVGDWKAEPMKGDLSDKDIPGQLFLNYVNQKTGDSITVALVCGRPGPVAIHTPDVCYPASGFKVGRKLPYSPPGFKDAHFFTTEVAHSSAADQKHQRIFWSWFAAGRWEAPENPRLTFTRRFPVLYKLYVLREMVADVPIEQDPCVEFLRQILPELEKALEPGTV
jgi:hypothetical protein